MSQSLAEIAELAESIAEDNIYRGKVNLLKIAKKNKIRIIEGNYGDYFLGELVHKANKFYIHLNMDQLDPKIPGRIRFTIAHEYGHYFTDDHRNKLKQGVSLAHTADYSVFSRNPIEKQANHFASNLLMPYQRSIKKCKSLDPGFDSVLSLRNIFETSIECTAIRYISLDLIPCMFIKWNADLTCKYSSYTDSLAKVVGLRGKPIIKSNPEYLRALFEEYDREYPQLEFVENITSLSKWIATISPKSKIDLMGLEQTIKLGDYGGMTFLVFNTQ